MKAGDITLYFLNTLVRLAPVGDSSIGWHIGAWQKRKRQGVHSFVAVAPTGRVVGTASVLIEQKHIHNCGKVAHIEDVVVAPDFDGQGVGHELVKACIHRAKLQSCYKVILDCDPKVSGFYNKLGFQTSGVQMRLDIA